MKEIDRLLADIEKNYGFTPDDLKVFREYMLKAAFAALLDNGVALSIMAEIERRSKQNV